MNALPSLATSFLCAPDRSLHPLFVRGALHLRPSARMMITFSCEKFSGTNSFTLYPRFTPISASPMPVFPAVASTIVPPGASLPFLLRPPDNPDGRAVLHASARVQVFELGEDVGRPGRNQPLQSQHGSPADQLGNVVGDAQMGDFRVFRCTLQGKGQFGIVNCPGRLPIAPTVTIVIVNSEFSPVSSQTVLALKFSANFTDLNTL
jgi:hypothetical protein